MTPAELLAGYEEVAAIPGFRPTTLVVASQPSEEVLALAYVLAVEVVESAIAKAMRTADSARITPVSLSDITRLIDALQNQRGE